MSALPAGRSAKAVCGGIRGAFLDGSVSLRGTGEFDALDGHEARLCTAPETTVDAEIGSQLYVKVLRGY